MKRNQSASFVIFRGDRGGCPARPGCLPAGRNDEARPRVDNAAQYTKGSLFSCPSLLCPRANTLSMAAAFVPGSPWFSKACVRVLNSEGVAAGEDAFPGLAPLAHTLHGRAALPSSTCPSRSLAS
jgi:hypothetical protein